MPEPGTGVNADPRWDWAKVRHDPAGGRTLTGHRPRGILPTQAVRRRDVLGESSGSQAIMVLRHWYFAYGSNMQTATFRGRRGIEFSRAVAARAAGWRLALDKPPLLPIGESFANIVADPSGTVLGVLYEVGDDDLVHIDLTEGVQIGNYRRIEIAVAPLAHPGEEWRAQTLVSDQRDATLRPSRRYLSCLISGAEEHGLPGDYVDWLRRLEGCEESEDARRLRPLLDRVMRRPR